MGRVIGIDPGKTTGLVSVSLDDEGNLGCIDPHQMDHMAVGHYMESMFGNWRLSGERPVVVIESFIITPATAKNSQAPWSLETIGLVRFFCDKAGIPLVFQTPAQAKRLATDDMLKAANLYFKGMPHACDAARHVFYYLATEKGALQDAIRNAI